MVLEEKLASCIGNPRLEEGGELWWVVIHSLLALAEATGMLRPLLLAIRSMRSHGKVMRPSHWGLAKQ